jgi:hypothetical protein
MPPGWVLNQCDRYVKKEQEFDKRIASWDLPTLDLVFEDLLWRGEGTTSGKIPPREAKRICQFLDVQNRNLFQVGLKRTTGASIPDVVANWDDVRAAVADSEYAYCLEGIDG